jgi:hypothetical protein
MKKKGASIYSLTVLMIWFYKIIWRDMLSAIPAGTILYCLSAIDSIP